MKTLPDGSIEFALTKENGTVSQIELLVNVGTKKKFYAIRTVSEYYEVVRSGITNPIQVVRELTKKDHIISFVKGRTTYLFYKRDYHPELI